MSVTGYDVRAALEDLLERDLLGPWDGPGEELPPGTTPGERYLLGKLVPRRDVDDEPVTDGTSTDEAGEDDDVEDRPELVEDAGVDLDPDSADDRPSAAAVRGRAMAASALGLSFTVSEYVDTVLVHAAWGRYDRGPSHHHVTETGKPRTVWHRHDAGGDVEIPVDVVGRDTAPPDSEHEQVVVRWRVLHRDQRRVVEVFLVNTQDVVKETPDRQRLFQATLTVTALDGARAVFCGHNDPDLPEMAIDTDDELRLLALQHRGQRLYASGRQCAVDAVVREGETRAWSLRTTCFPAADVLAVQPGDVADLPGVLLDMARLGSPDLEVDDMVAGLRPLVTGYRTWLDAQRARITNDPEIRDRFARVASDAWDRAIAVAERLDRAVNLLAGNALAREAFRFANQAMARQRVRSELVRRRLAQPDLSVMKALREVDVVSNRSWRPFQLAFVLLCLPGLTEPAHPDAGRGPLMQGDAQLLFFPTGGGKTEAYLGLTAYTIAIRRLQGLVGTGADARDGTRGVGVLMRYTLRLLTAQQFQRATALIAACELLRLERVAAGDTRWGSTPMRIGLWVGSAVSPNNVDEAVRQLEDASAHTGEGQVGGLLQFAACPWCGTSLSLGRDGHADKARRRTLLYCGDADGRCPFSRARSPEGLPVVVVDEEIYRLTPDLVIGTVDKFAALPWRSATAELFGHVVSECDRHGFRNPDTDTWCRDGGHPKSGTLPSATPHPVTRLRPPDLIIQDELHLISDALGSMVGLYETLIDRLCTRTEGGVDIRPVLIASTATVRRARQQVAQVFARGLTVFPPPLLDAGDTFFSRRVAASASTPARRYRGVMASGERLTAVEIRVMTALLEYGQHLLDRHGRDSIAAVDPYLTVVDYFTSTRELAGMNRLVEDDVAERLQRQHALVRRRAPIVEELTSRMPSSKITQSLAQLERRFDHRFDSTEGTAALRLLRREDRAAWDAEAGSRSRPLDVLLATSMLQVGVDVQRLGLMVVTGQPKNMAEYIQASSRVGRSAAGPGLVVTIYNWNRPRDLSHYEAFGYEHTTFGRRVEGLTTTPYSRRALDRGLTGVVVGALRHRTDAGLPNGGAHDVALSGPDVAALVAAIRERAECVTDSAEGGQVVADHVTSRLDRWALRRSKQLGAGLLGYEADTSNAAGLLRRPDQIPWNEWSAPLSLRDVEPEVLLQLRHADPSWEDRPAWDFTPRAPGGTA